MTILFITHDPDQAICLASRIFVLDAHLGRIPEIIDANPPGTRSPAQFFDPFLRAVKQQLEKLIRRPDDKRNDNADRFPIQRCGFVADEVL